MEIASRPRNGLVAIDLLRFGAAMMVLLCHYFGPWALAAKLQAGPDVGPSGLVSNVWLQSGWIGVEIFFVISGYVIAASANNASAADFARRRLLRLWPGALVCATITTLVLLACGLTWAQVMPAYAGSATLGLVGGAVDPVYWTLQVECIFYALVTLLLAIGRWDAVKVALALSFWSLAFLAWTLGPFGAAPAATELAKFFIAPFGAFFGMGILLHQAHHDPASVRSWMFLPCFIGAPLCIQGLVAAADAASSFEPQLLFALGVAVIALSARLQSSFRSERLARFAVALGLATYPLYLLHHYVGEAMLIHALRLGVSPAYMVGPVILIMILSALFISRFVEPALRARLAGLLHWRPRALAYNGL